MRIIKAIFRRILIKLINLFYILRFKLVHNNQKQNLLIYTDSRGFLVDCMFCNKTPYKSYIEKLSKEYNIDYKLCIHKHTTILDFLNDFNYTNFDKYSRIILHLGIVDFSPRPLSQLQLVYNKKQKIFNKIFPTSGKMKPNYYDEIYENEKTFSLYNFDAFSLILNRLHDISKKTPILWIGINTVDLNWNGNYFKNRPNNINIILEYQNYIENYLNDNKIKTIEYINIDKVKDFNLKVHTLDNMHLTEEGFNFFYKVIKERLTK